LRRITGEVWSPSEVQEVVWSWSYALDDLVDFKRNPGLQRADLRALIEQVTDERIMKVPDFTSQLQTGANRAALEAAGLSAPALRAATAPASSSLRAVSEATSGVGAEAATAVGRSGSEPNIEDLIEIADNIRRHSQGDVQARLVTDIVRPIRGKGGRPKIRTQAIDELTEEGTRLSKTAIDRRVREIKKRP